MRARRTSLLLVPAVAVAALLPAATGPVALAGAPDAARETTGTTVATQTGRGGAVASADPDATRIGLQVLADGGNAVDAAVAVAAALGVTEPFSTGIGGGGYLVHLDGRTGRVLTLDGRETAPRRSSRDLFVDPATGNPYELRPDLVTSGLAVGAPGTVATWEKALDRWGSRSLADLLRPAADLAREGFVVDRTFADQVARNADRFAQIAPTAKLFLPGGAAPEVGSVFRNPQLAETYEQLGARGARLLHRGKLGRNVVTTVRRPPTLEGELPVPPGRLAERDLGDYAVLARPALTTRYRGFDVHGMASSSSGGSTVGQALTILGRLPLVSATDEAVEHAVLEAGALAFADREEYVGDRQFVAVPDQVLLDPEYADERLCAVSLTEATAKPLAAGRVTAYDGTCDSAGREATLVEDHENQENSGTTHLVVADRWGDVVSYSLSLGETGGSGIVVPGRGFLLNNQLTDFSLVWKRRDPNRVEPGKRPRSSMAPTIVTRDGEPFLALGSPGGSTGTTTVLGLLVDVIDRGASLAEAVAAPRASQRNTTYVDAEQAWIDGPGRDMESLGHLVRLVGTPGSEIGAATGLEFGRSRTITAVAEPVRRGGGDARVVDPR